MKDWELSTQNSIGIVAFLFFIFSHLKTVRFDRASFFSRGYKHTILTFASLTVFFVSD